MAFQLLGDPRKMKIVKPEIHWEIHHFNRIKNTLRKKGEVIRLGLTALFLQDIFYFSNQASDYPFDNEK